MIVDEQHRVLHLTAQEVCAALSVEEFQRLNPRAQVALTQLAIYAGCTQVAWWPTWLNREEAVAKVGILFEGTTVPEVSDFPEEDLRIERWRSTGSVGDPSNAVRILHVPSGNIVESSERGSYHLNRRRALDKLRLRLEEEKAGICPICKYPVNSGPCQRSHS
jgi:hypothetical protein